MDLWNFFTDRFVDLCTRIFSKSTVSSRGIVLFCILDLNSRNLSFKSPNPKILVYKDEFKFSNYVQTQSAIGETIWMKEYEVVKIKTNFI